MPQQGEFYEVELSGITAKYFNKKSISNSWADAKWDTSPTFAQKKLISQIALKKKQDFSKNRQITGLLAKPSIRLEITSPFTFFDKTYPLGTHSIDLSKNMDDEIEFTSNKDIVSLNSTELHFRGRVDAVSAYRSVWGLLKNLGLTLADKNQNENLHVHMVQSKSSLPYQNNKILSTLALVEFYRRINLIMELIDIQVYGVSLAAQSDDSGTSFNSLNNLELSSVLNYLLMQDGKKFFSSDVRARLGFRMGRKYKNHSLFGFEYRRIDNGSHPEIAEELLGSIQYRLLSGRYGLTRKVLESFISTVVPNWKKMPKKELMANIDLISKLHNPTSLYNHPNKKINVAMRSISGYHDESLDFTSQRRAFPEMKLLYRDWRVDPVILNLSDKERRSTIRKLEKAQIESIYKLKDGKIRQVVEDFIETTKIDEMMYKTLLYMPDIIKKHKK